MRVTIKQRKPKECGVACVATIAGISLREARTLMGHTDNNKEPGWTGTEDLRKALAKKKLKLGRETYCSDWTHIAQRLRTGIVAVNAHYRKGVLDRWHWIVYDSSDPKHPIRDPQAKQDRRSPGRTRAYSYFHVRQLRPT